MADPPEHLTKLGSGSIEVKRDGGFIRLTAWVDGGIVAEFHLSDAAAKYVGERLLQEARMTG